MTAEFIDGLFELGHWLNEKLRVCGLSSNPIRSFRPRILGTRIHQIHVKNDDMLLSTPGGRLDWPRMAQQFCEIGYGGWYVLETSSPTKDIVRRHAREHRVREEEDVPDAAGVLNPRPWRLSRSHAPVLDQSGETPQRAATAARA
jgi:hypothetical protein